MTRRSRRFLLFFFLFLSHSQISSLAFNPLGSTHPHILQDVVEKIGSKQRWEVEGLNFTRLEVSKARFGSGRRYEFRIRFGKTHLLFNFPDEVTSWNNFTKGSGDDFLDFVKHFNSTAVLDSFKLQGPFELLLPPNQPASLLLPLNTSHAGLKRVLVGEGITVQVNGAQEISLFHAFNFGLPLNANVAKEKNGYYWPFGYSSCKSWLPVHVLGSVSLVAYQARNPDARVGALFLSNDTIKLLPEKCYGDHAYMRQSSPMDSIGLRIARLRKILGTFLGDRNDRNGGLGSIKVKTKASPLIHFQLELEKHIGKNESVRSTLAEWRTKPTVERLSFDVEARVEAEKLKPLVIKKVAPFVSVDTISWSNLMSNISFTKFPPLLGPPEALTLDVKW